VSPTITDAPPEELGAVRAGVLPPRYGYRMQDVFAVRLMPLLTEGTRVLDVGAGRAPTIAPEGRPAGCTYVGLDAAAGELAAAPPGAYDETIVHDITRPLAPTAAFDLVISWQVLEHVDSLAAALETMRGALKPGGMLLAQLSGRYAAFAVLARLLSHRIRVYLLGRRLGHAQEEKFPVRYDHCTARDLERLLEPWGSREIIPFYRGATYLSELRLLQRVYLAYESALAGRDARNYATHYLIIAKR
jgi:SAM-dependent methyltransferase